MGDTDKNYLSWQQTGWDWYVELKLRRQTMPVYESQESYLKRFFAGKAAEWLREKGRPLKVLEFGCGFGRHLRYLHRIQGLEVHGCDQSPAMVQAAQTLLCGRFPELKGRIIQVEPKGRLPYDDGAFDVVYTVSVLIHVSPEDLFGRTAELRRVASHLVVNLELPWAPHSFLWDQAHEGVWLHDFVGAHQAAGPCRVEVDADTLGPVVVIYTVARDGDGLRVLHKGRWTDDCRQAEMALTDVILEYGKYSREQAQQRGREAAAQLARNAALQLESIQQSRAFRLARWLDGRPRLKWFLSGGYEAAFGLRKVALRALGRRRQPEAVGTSPPDVAARAGGAREGRRDAATGPPTNGAVRENGY